MGTITASKALRRCLETAGAIDRFALAELARHASFEVVPAGEAIIRQGDTDASFYIIVDGAVRVVVNEGEVIEVARLGSGDVFGEMSAAAPQPRSATVIATEPTQLIRFDGRRVQQMLHQHPALHSYLFSLGLSRTESNLRA